MKKTFFILLIILFFTNKLHAQTSTSLIINDTRAVNDPPNSFRYEIRADFKAMSAIGVPGQGYYSTTLTVSP